MIEEYKISATVDYMSNTVLINDNQTLIKLGVNGEYYINWPLLCELAEAYKSGQYTTVSEGIEE